MMSARENDMKRAKRLRRVLSVVVAIFCFAVSAPQTARGGWLSDAGEFVGDGLSDVSQGLNNGMNSFIESAGTSAAALGEAFYDAGEAVSEFFTGKQVPTVPKLLAPTQREISVGFNGVLSGQNLYLRNDGLVLTEINAGVAGSPVLVLKQFEITTPHDHVTGTFQNPVQLPAYFNPIERKVGIVTVAKLVGACRNSSSGTASYRVPVTIKATLDPNFAIFPGGMNSSITQQLNQFKNTTIERTEELVLTLTCRSSAIVSRIFNESCPVGYVLEGANTQMTQHQLAETEPISAIQRSRCVRP